MRELWRANENWFPQKVLYKAGERDICWKYKVPPDLHSVEKRSSSTGILCINHQEVKNGYRNQQGSKINKVESLSTAKLTHTHMKLTHEFTVVVKCGNTKWHETLHNTWLRSQYFSYTAHCAKGFTYEWYILCIVGKCHLQAIHNKYRDFK